MKRSLLKAKQSSKASLQNNEIFLLLKWSDQIALFCSSIQPLQDLHKLGKCSACVQYLLVFVYATGNWQRLEDTMRLSEVLFLNISHSLFASSKRIISPVYHKPLLPGNLCTSLMQLFYFTLLWEVHFLVGNVAFSSGLNYTNKHTIIAYFAPGQLERNRVSRHIFNGVFHPETKWQTNTQSLFIKGEEPTIHIIYNKTNGLEH